MEFKSFVLLFCITFTLVCLGSSSANRCVYHVDASSSEIKVVCETGAVLNIVDEHGQTLLASETSVPGEIPIVFKMNRSNIQSVHDEVAKSMDKLKNAAGLLRKVREKLTTQVNELINLTKLLHRGDAELKKDLETLRRQELSSPLVREAIIAALQNQYNFLRMGLLTQNAQLIDLISTSMTLTTTVLKTARGSFGIGGVMDLRVNALNDTLSNITKLMPGGFGNGMFFGEETVLCPQELVSISTVGTQIINGVEQGTVMRDPFTREKLWLTTDFVNVNEISEYNSIRDLKFELVEKIYELPFSCVGTGHVIFKKRFFCQKMFTNKIVMYSLEEGRWLAEKPIIGVGVHNTFPYQSRKNSDIDFAVDEIGLWVVYATQNSRGNIVISKLNETDLTFERTWITEIQKENVGNTFMICGVLYATDSYENIPTFIKYKYDTNVNQGQTLAPEKLQFINSLKETSARVYALDYSPVDRALYSWNNGRIEIYPVSFTTAEEP